MTTSTTTTGNPTFTREALLRLVLKLDAVVTGVWLVATRPAISRRAVMAIAGANALWVIASLAFAITGVSSPTTVGTVWIVLQALVVGGFAFLQGATAGGATAAR
jgi:nicotinamide mononucleotide (NMN) deamidase PncC